MAYVKIWIHAVWGTKNRFPYLSGDIRKQVIDHIRENAKKKGIFIDSINGYTEHLHCLMALNADMSMAKAMQLIKGESAFWINKNQMTKEKFEWAVEYYATSVSDSARNKVRDYIRNQEAHHGKSSFQEEYEQFIKEYNFESQG